jgi:NADH-quinone oxidoreductase subunit F
MSAEAANTLERLAEKGLQSMYPSRIKIAVGMATCGLATGAQDVFDALEKAIAGTDLDAVLSRTGCLGFCQREPLVDVYVPGKPRLTFADMTPARAIELVDALKQGTFPREYALCWHDVEMLLGRQFKQYEQSSGGAALSDIPLYRQVPFFAKQYKIALRNCGYIDPGSLEEYAARSGYASLRKALVEMSPEEVIEEVKKSGLRGRGGGGFPTGLKWEFTRKAAGEIKYIICNADEGDPGAYMDRSVLEGDPHTVIEGMIIGGYAIGASKGFIYVRTEYPLAIARLRTALAQATSAGLLGQDIFGSGFSFDIQIREGSGAFVCGEETSLMHSIEGVSPEPRNRPPFPAESGLWESPTSTTWRPGRTSRR